MQRRMRSGWLLLALAAGLGSACQAGAPVLQGTSRAQARAPGVEDRGLGAESYVAASNLDADDEAAFSRGQPMPVPPGRKGRWLVVSNHNHSTYWDGKKPLRVLQQEAWLRNVDALVLTDHNTMAGVKSPEFQNPPYDLIMVKGMEWNAFREKGEPVVGHAGLLGLSPDVRITTGLGLDPMLAEAHAADATIVVNHPFCKNNEWAQPKPDPRAHAVEVWNGWWYRANFLVHNDLALAWWDQALKEGRRLTALAGTDCHGEFYKDVANGISMVFAETPDEQGILKGVREGRVSLTASPSSARVFLEADADGDGTYEAIMGDTVPRAAKGTLNVRARVLGASGKKVVFYTRAGRQAIRDVSGADAAIPFTVALDAKGQPDFVRAEVRKFPHLPFSMTALANPIYVTGTGE